MIKTFRNAATNYTDLKKHHKIPIWNCNQPKRELKNIVTKYIFRKVSANIQNCSLKCGFGNLSVYLFCAKKPTPNKENCEML